MNSPTPLVRAVCEVLQQDRVVIERLSDAQYVERHPCCFNSTIGAHMRHNLDHVVCFLDGLEPGSVDYEGRGREPVIEADRSAALDLIDSCLRRLGEIGEGGGDRSLRVREESGEAALVPAWLPSSVARELQFLLGHTVHHNALVATILWSSGIALPAGFGVAPSTQRHQAGVGR